MWYSRYLKAVLFVVVAAMSVSCSHPSVPYGSDPGPGPQMNPNFSQHGTTPNRGQNGRSPQRNSPNRSHSNLSNSDATAGERALIKAVESVGGASVNGRLDPNICSLTRDYARTMANQGFQDGHRGFDQRMRSLGGGGSEITAESWGTAGSSLQKHANECVEGWMGSSGHRRSMMAYHARFCYSMAQGRNGRYYCVGLFADSAAAGSSFQTAETSEQELSPHARSGARRSGSYGGERDRTSWRSQTHRSR